MLDRKDHPEAIARFSLAVANLATELTGAGVDPQALAAGLRIEVGKIEEERRRKLPGMPDMPDQELLDLQRRAHEFINTLQVAGLEERTIVTCLVNAAVERVARINGAAGAGQWLRGLAGHVDANAAAINLLASQN